jgi:hypothetical protein
MPAVEEVEQQLVALLRPSLLAPRQMERRDPRQPQRVIRMRQRLLTLPVMVAIVVSLVWRRMPAVTEVQRVLAREGLLWVTPMRVSPPALIKRLDALPAAVMGQLFAEVCARLQAQRPPALPVWLKYCVASSGLSMVVAEQATEAFSPHHVTRLTTHRSLRRDESVVETLMIALGMIVDEVLVDHMIQGAFTQHDHPC